MRGLGTAPPAGPAVRVSTARGLAPPSRVHVQDNVGVLDTTTDTFSTISTGWVAQPMYDGAAAVGARIFFAPYSPNGNQDKVGELNLAPWIPTA